MVPRVEPTMNSLLGPLFGTSFTDKTWIQMHSNAEYLHSTIVELHAALQLVWRLLECCQIEEARALSDWLKQPAPALGQDGSAMSTFTGLHVS